MQSSTTQNIATIFKQVAYEKAKVTLTGIRTQACEDQFVGLLKIERKNAHFTQWIKTSLTDANLRQSMHDELEQQTNIPVLAIILESPHKQEYAGNIPMPACGKTGDNIYKLLPKYLNCISATLEQDNISQGVGFPDIQSGTYRVLLINAIQYQCSLGEKTKKYRDEIFDKMWENGDVRTDFANRLTIHPLRVIINCCTASAANFRKKIQKVISNSINCCDTALFHAYHPCQWQPCIAIEPGMWKN